MVYRPNPNSRSKLRASVKELTPVSVTFDTLCYRCFLNIKYTCFTQAAFSVLSKNAKLVHMDREKEYHQEAMDRLSLRMTHLDDGTESDSDNPISPLRKCPGEYCFHCLI